MTNSTQLPTAWAGTRGDLTMTHVAADMSVEDVSYAEEYVTIVQPNETGLVWPIRLTIKRDEGAFVVSDDFSDIYGEGESKEAAVADYREALVRLERVLSDRAATLSDDLARQLALLRSVIPPEG